MLVPLSLEDIPLPPASTVDDGKSAVSPRRKAALSGGFKDQFTVVHLLSLAVDFFIFRSGSH